MFQQFMKQNKANTKYKHDFYLAFAFIANKLDPLEKPFYKLGLRVSSGFLKIRIQSESTRPAASFFHQFAHV